MGNEFQFLSSRHGGPGPRDCPPFVSTPATAFVANGNRQRPSALCTSVPPWRTTSGVMTYCTGRKDLSERATAGWAHRGVAYLTKLARHEVTVRTPFRDPTVGTLGSRPVIDT